MLDVPPRAAAHTRGATRARGGALREQVGVGVRVRVGIRARARVGVGARIRGRVRFGDRVSQPV